MPAVTSRALIIAGAAVGVVAIIRASRPDAANLWAGPWIGGTPTITDAYKPVQGGAYVPDGAGKYVYTQASARSFWGNATAGTTIPDKVGGWILGLLFGPASKLFTKGNAPQEPPISFAEAHRRSTAWAAAVSALAQNELGDNGVPGI